MIDKRYYRLAALFVAVLLISAGLTIAIKDIEHGLGVNDKGKTRADEKITFVSRELSASEMKRMKAELGVKETGKDYNEIINGHGTGYAPPSEETYEDMADDMKVVEDVKGPTDQILSDSDLDLTERKYFPPIGNQGQQGSCAAWGIVYYSNTFLQAKAHGLNASTGNEEYLMSPAWAYNKVNGGEDGGSHIYSLSDVLDDLGCANLETMPYDASNVTAWGDEDAWRCAPQFRTGDFESTSSVDVVKTWLQDEHLVNLALDANEYEDAFGYFGDDNVMTSEEYVENETNHVNTIVGYNDSISQDGETGAFKVANSWGSYWGPNDDGTYWMTYDCFGEIVGGYKSAYRLIDPYYEGEQEHPKLLGTWGFSETGSRTASTEVGIGPSNNPVESRDPLYSSDGGDHPYPDFMAVDMTKFADDWNEGQGETNFYLEMGQSSGETTISSFDVEYYDSGYEIGAPTFESENSPDVPSTIPSTVEVEFTGDEGSDGEITLNKDVYPAQDTVQIELFDSDVAGTGSQNVDIYSDTEGSNETVQLSESDDSPGKFTGSIDISKSGVNDLIISHGDTITVYYEDDNVGDGSSQLKTDSAHVDAESPQVTSTEPFDNEQSVPIDTERITVDFSENIDTSTVDGSTIDITPDVGHGLLLDQNSSKMDVPLYTDGNYQDGDYAASCYKGYVCVQGFEPQTSGEISSLKLNMFKLGNPPEDLKVQLIDGAPEGQALMTKYIEPSDVGTGSEEASWISLNLEDPIQVDAGAQYGIRCSMEDAGSEEDRYRLSLTDNSYDKGYLSQYDPENDKWNDLDGYDTCFAYQMKDDRLQSDTDYQVTVSGSISDQVGNTMGEDYSFSFSTTGSDDEGPTASFDYTPSNPTTEDTVQFQDGSTPENDIVSWNWNFGDSSTSTQADPAHSYSSSGTYTVELTVTDNEGATDTTTKNITVQSSEENTVPTADFSYDPTEPTSGETIQFTDTSEDLDGSISSYSWNFGDGSSSTEASPSHTYSSSGTYTVELTVTDDDGATDSKTQDISVQSDTQGYSTVEGGDTSYDEYITNVNFNGINKDSGDDGGYADHTGSVSETCAPGQSYELSVTLSTGGYSEYVTAVIDWGQNFDLSDDTVVEVGNGNSEPLTVTKDITVPSDASNGETRMRVMQEYDGYHTDPTSNQEYGETEDYTVTIGEDEEQNEAPTADFSFTPADPTEGEAIQFTDSSSDSDGSIASYSWYFGDGSSSTEESPYHTYSSSGTYTVELIVTDNEGASDSISKTVDVSGSGGDLNTLLDEDFEGDSAWSTSGLWHRVDESDQYGDSYSSSHSMWYGQDSTGNYDTGSHTTGQLTSPCIDLTQASQAELSFEHWFKTENCDEGEYDKVIVKVNNNRVYYRNTKDENVGSENSFVKETIDLSALTGQTVELKFIFDSVDDYDNAYRGWYVDDITVKADSDGESNTAPSASFSFSPASPTVGETVQFSDSSTDDDGDIASYSWDFGDGTTSSQQDPSHPYGSPGTYTVSLSVEDDDGATDTVSKTIDVSEDGEEMTTIFEDDFESSSGWSTSGLWHRVDESDQYGDSYSSSHSMWYGQDSTGDYDTGSRTKGQLVSESIDMTQASQAELSFRHWFKTEDHEDSYDHVKVKINDEKVYFRDTSDENVGSENNFVKETIDISEYAGQTVNIKFCFDTLDDYDNAYRGWYVDDVSVKADEGSAPSSETVLLSEVYYDVEGTDSEGEYIELFNPGSDPVELSGWSIKDDSSSSYSFDDSISIPGGTHLTVCRDKDTFESEYGKTPDAWDLPLSLNNGGDTLTLYDTDGQTVDEVGWEQDAWSELSASTGEVIRREDTSEDTDTVEDWIVSQPDPQVVDGGGSSDTIFYEDFENGNPWNTSGLWHLTQDSDQYGDSSSGSKAMWYGQDSTGNYDTGSHTTGILTSPTIDLNGVSGATLSFEHWFKTEDHEGEYDWCKVTVNGDQVYYRDTSDDNVGSENNFVKETIDISGYAGQTIQVKFIFDSVDDYDNDYRGWYIDDVTVEEQVSTNEQDTVYQDKAVSSRWPEKQDTEEEEGLDILTSGEKDARLNSLKMYLLILVGVVSIIGIGLYFQKKSIKLNY